MPIKWLHFWTIRTRHWLRDFIAASITTVAAVLVQKSSSQNAASISGGLLSGGLNAFTINPAGYQLEYKHERNILSDIWYEPVASKIYPASIWYVLNEKRFSSNHKEPLIRTIKDRWKKFELDGRTDDPDIQLLFQQGGLYDADALQTCLTNYSRQFVRLARICKVYY